MQTGDKINLAIAIIAGLSTITSLAVVVATFKILQANREAVAVMKEQVRSVTRPYIQVTPWARVGTTLLMLTVRNAGAIAANKVKLTMDKDFYSNAEQIESGNLRKYTAFAHPIESLPPRAELSFHLGVGHVIFSKPEQCPPIFSITAEYEFGGERVREVCTVDLQPFMLSALPVDPVAEQLEKLNETAGKIANKLQ